MSASFHLPARHGQHDLFIFCGSGIERRAVHQHEDASRGRANALVAVNEWMILDQVKQIGGSHRRDVWMKVFAGKRRGRHGERRLEQGRVAELVAAAIPRDRFAVEIKHFVEGEEERRIHSASFFSVESYLSNVSVFAAWNFSLRSLGFARVI
jgi:hypothetical protein